MRSDLAHRCLRELLEHENVLRVMQVRHMRLEVFVNIAREFLRTRGRPDTRLFGVEAQLLIVFRNGFR